MTAVDDMTLGDMVTDNAVHFPDVVAYRHGDRSVTHAQLRDRAVRLVSAMAAAGVKRQDRIAVLSRNSIEFGELNAAAHLSGIIMATISFRLSPPEIDDALRRVSPSIIFCAEEFMPVIADVAARMPSGPVLVTIGGEAPPGIIGYERFIQGGPSGELEFTARPDDIAWMTARLTPHPWRCFTQPLQLSNEAALWEIPQTVICCTSNLAFRDPSRMEPARAAGRVWDIDTGHDLMITEPEAVAELLLRVAAT